MRLVWIARWSSPRRIKRAVARCHSASSFFHFFSAYRRVRLVVLLLGERRAVELRLRLAALRLRLVRLEPLRLAALRLRFVRLDALRLRLAVLRLCVLVLRLDELREDDLRLGTLAPERRACDSPIAMACLRLLTGLRARPLFSWPRLYSRMALPTFFLELLLYFGIVAPFERSLCNR